MVIKKVPVDGLKPGMFIHDLNCGWMDHPFLRPRFALRSDREIESIAEAGLREVYIDTALGLDASDAPTREEVAAEVHEEMRRLAGQAAGPARISAREELVRARRVHAEANRLVRNLLHDVRLGKQVQVEQAEPMVSKITASILCNNGALLSLTRIKSKDGYTFEHSVSVCALMVAFSRGLGLAASAIHEAGIGGLLHDAGKMRTPDEVLNKPGSLSDEEFAIMRHHVVAGRAILQTTPGISGIALDVAVQHHERYDGSGYPQRLRGKEISFYGQMAAIVDVYDAITSDRVYHKALAPTDALRKIFEWSRFHFKPELVHAFTRTVGIYPVGTLVLLESGRLAVVVEQREESLLQPLVRAFYDTRRGSHLNPEDIDLSRPMGHGGADRILGHELPEKWRLDPMKFL